MSTSSSFSDQHPALSAILELAGRLRQQAARSRAKARVCIDVETEPCRCEAVGTEAAGLEKAAAKVEAVATELKANTCAPGPAGAASCAE